MWRAVDIVTNVRCCHDKQKLERLGQGAAGELKHTGVCLFDETQRGSRTSAKSTKNAAHTMLVGVFRPPLNPLFFLKSFPP